MRVVVAGGRGFIGNHVVRRLRAGGHDVVPAGEGEVAGAIAVAPVDGVVWAAGKRADDDALMQHQHVDAPLAALAALPADSCFVYLSTGELYGAAPVPFRESAAIDARHAYARAKADGEVRLAAAAAVRDVRLVILRLALVYGEGQTGAMFLPALIDHVRQARPMALTGGEQTRDYVHVDDVTAAITLALEPSTPPATFNIGSGIETPLREVGAMVVAALEADPDLLRWGELPYRDNEQMRYVFDISLARAALGFAPSVPLAEGIARTVGRSVQSDR